MVGGMVEMDDAPGATEAEKGPGATGRDGEWELGSGLFWEGVGGEVEKGSAREESETRGGENGGQDQQGPNSTETRATG